jgi:AraC-like DNA-binding protein
MEFIRAQPQIQYLIITIQKNINSKIEIKYQKSTLTDVMAKQTHIELTKLLNDEKLYKTPELTLSELAKRLNISSHHLSQVINTFEKKNFFDYINHKRVEEFKKCVHLPENQKFTFLSLAFECGFNSKTSFNRNFKKVTNFSPSDYLKQENIHLQE